MTTVASVVCYKIEGVIGTRETGLGSGGGYL